VNAEERMTLAKDRLDAWLKSYEVERIGDVFDRIEYALTSLDIHLCDSAVWPEWNELRNLVEARA